MNEGENVMKCGRVWMFIVVIAALVVATMAALWPQERVLDVIYIARFFDLMLPILAVGALVQYVTGNPSRAWSILIVIVALVVAILNSAMSGRSDEFVLIARFFNAALPILAVGALIKYLGLVSRFWSTLIVIIALIIAVLSVILPPGRILDVIYVTRFFDIMLPILATGALIKYLFIRWCGSTQQLPISKT
jgi:hypothetical protein